jgi:hypothetical protein
MDFLICGYGCLAIPLESDNVSSMLFYFTNTCMSTKNIHIGSLIKEQFEEKLKRDKHISKTEFAELIHVHRSTIYPMFKQKSIDIELLIRISKALDYDFLKEVKESRIGVVNSINYCCAK